MNKIIIMACAVLALAFSHGTYADAASGDHQSRQLGAIVSAYSGYDGVDVVKVGSLGTSLLRNLLRVSVMEDIRDPETRAILGLVRDIKGITIMDYEEAPRRVREEINAAVRSLYSDQKNLLMELKDGGEDMYIFATVKADGSDLKDLVLHTPSEGALIWIKGNISIDAIAAVARQ